MMCQQHNRTGEHSMRNKTIFKFVIFDKLEDSIFPQEFRCRCRKWEHCMPRVEHIGLEGM